MSIKPVYIFEKVFSCVIFSPQPVGIVLVIIDDINNE
jgi:hypothetical protein